MGFIKKLFGGGNQGAAGKMGELLQVLITDLNLSADQVERIKEYFKAFREQRREIKSAGGDQSQIKQARIAMKDQLLGVLNDQQKQLYQANVAKYEGILFQ